MRLYIPEIGDVVKLEKDWTFDLMIENRNFSLLEDYIPRNILDKFYDYWRVPAPKSILEKHNLVSRKSEPKWYNEDEYEYFRPVTLSAGTLLKVDRIYVRKNMEAYSSITFLVENKKNQQGKKIRFWVSLTNANLMEITNEKIVLPATPAKPKRRHYTCYYIVCEPEYKWVGYGHKARKTSEVINWVYHVRSELRTTIKSEADWLKDILKQNATGKIKTYAEWDASKQKHVYPLIDGELIAIYETEGRYQEIECIYPEEKKGKPYDYKYSESWKNFVKSIAQKLAKRTGHDIKNNYGW